MGGTDPPNGADRDRDGWVAPDDCDDTDPRLRPEAPETVDGIDEDCDGSVDESTSALLSRHGASRMWVGYS